jgi:hypothetical protein
MVKRILRSATIIISLIVFFLVLLTIANALPWPVYGAAGFVWGAGLVAVAVFYGLKNRDEISPTGFTWGAILAIVGYLLLIILNQLINWDYLHKDHKLLAFIFAFVFFVAWINLLKYRTRTRSSAKRLGNK